MQERDDLQKASVVRPIDNGNVVQLLCSDDRGLLSVYFDHGQFEVFLNYLYAVSLDLEGLHIQFDKDHVFVPRCGKCFNRRLSRQKVLLPEVFRC